MRNRNTLSRNILALCLKLEIFSKKYIVLALYLKIEIFYKKYIGTILKDRNISYKKILWYYICIYT